MTVNMEYEKGVTDDEADRKREELPRQDVSQL